MLRIPKSLDNGYRLLLSSESQLKGQIRSERKDEEFAGLPRILFNRPVLADVVVLRDLHLPVPLKLLTENLS